jgi:drug/metabolite transporter (DMT)-like permease
MSSHPPIPHADRVLPGVALMIVFCVIAPLIDVSAKNAVQSVSVAQVTLARMLVQGALMLPVVVLMRQSLRLPPGMALLLALRALMLVGSTASFVAALRFMPLAEALAIAFVEPLILMWLGAVFFAERVGPRRLAASVLGFAGALLVIQPNFERFGAVALLPLLAAGFFALYLLLTRRITRSVPPEAMQFHTAWMAVVWMLPALALGQATGIADLSLRAAPVWGWLFGVGLAATLAHLAITHALRLAPAATVAPLGYLEIVTAVGFGWLFFAEWPNALAWAGIAVICGAGLYIIWRERITARTARRPDPQ